MSQRFQKRIEDFQCAHCQAQVHGTGYTNHCPQCLWSKHVDHHPGDRQAACGGLMEPVALALIHDEFQITHRCQTCGQERHNRADAQDDRNVLLGIAEQAARRRSYFGNT